eukprot:3440460-Pyramimonas_sp.AAC.1
MNNMNMNPNANSALNPASTELQAMNILLNVTSVDGACQVGTPSSPVQSSPVQSSPVRCSTVQSSTGAGDEHPPQRHRRRRRCQVRTPYSSVQVQNSLQYHSSAGDEHPT